MYKRPHIKKKKNKGRPRNAVFADYAVNTLNSRLYELGMTQMELLEKTKHVVTQPTLSRVLNGRNGTSMETFAVVCDMLDLEIIIRPKATMEAAAEVDAHNSSESVAVMDAESGEYELVSPEQIFKVDENMDPVDEMRTALEAIEQERHAIFGDNAMPTKEQVDTPAPIDGNNDPKNIPTEGNNEAENIPTTADTSEFARGYEESLERTRSFSDERLAKEIEDLRGDGVELTDYGRGMLEAYKYEQKERARSVHETAESVPNPTEKRSFRY